MGPTPPWTQMTQLDPLEPSIYQSSTFKSFNYELGYILCSCLSPKYWKQGYTLGLFHPIPFTSFHPLKKIRKFIFLEVLKEDFD